ncbi:polysaccharide export inner-membrane protein, BexC/CtrB/KpsE family [Necator americanus]|uniref:Polysaccharide export inner-membrane protein, BexC/CtrB/KpsE family n=1 Tax=Necator americanus TaxID=51031 RepID=W2U0N9_NECAM|nr:polysaccharide export inner-membrane protein, BexC/CtrB/KpsE family [Necator americanus]ETN86867.1 polysaccharide export inner-membrane protein, BexC/CtrB/KpsE family [Necator americanus]
MSVVGALLEGSGISHSEDDTYPVLDYIQSRDALRELDQNNYVLNAYSRQGDFISRFHTSFDNSFESLRKYYSNHVVEAKLDPISSITTLTTRAYSAEDAKRINNTLVEISERLINRLNARAASDAITFAQRQVNTALGKAKDAASELALYRNSHTVFDPEKQSALQLQQVNGLQTQLFAAQSQLGQLQAVSPQNPQIPSIKTYITTIEKQIDVATGSVAGGKNSLSQKASEYTRLELDAQLADKQLASAMASLDNARAEAERKQLYLEVLVQPNAPDIAIEPKRLRGIAATFCVGLILWGVLSLLIASVREHQD